MGRPPIIRARFEGELVVDNFAGGGGASTGIEAALGRPVDIAINHDPRAIAMHRANHPETKHFQEDIWSVDPKVATGGRPVGLAWFSPDCTHHSRAKGGKPLDSGIRALAWVVVHWARHVRPRVIALENVEEFQDWGPLGPDKRPVKELKGETFRQWTGALSDLGYTIDFRSLVAADYGTPTTRKRLFMIARRDHQPLVWPEPTHGQGRTEPWHAAAEIIDWSIPCPSIFERERPLADATMRRIAEGVKRYVIEAAQPFIVPLTHQGDSRVHSINDPLRTVTGAHRGEFALVAPTLVEHNFNSRQGAPVTRPLHTVTTQSNRFGLVAALMTKHYGGVVGHDLRRPIGTVTAKDHHALSVAFLSKLYHTAVGSSMNAPLPTVTSGGGKGGGHLAQVRAFLVHYYSSGGQWQGLRSPLHTVTGKGRFGLVMVHGEPYQIIDIGMRMLQPHELFLAQGFPEDYVIAPIYNGKPMTKTDQIFLVGNAVPPQESEGVVGANARA
jgi:DNA (cytosine-5)-methyltransferase 1